MSRSPTPEPAGEWESSEPPVAEAEEVLQPLESPTAGAPAVTDPELPLPDVPLVVEDLLKQARRLADSGGPSEAVKAILDHVADLREGRC